MTAVKDKSKAAADQMNIAAKNAEQAVRCVTTDYFCESMIIIFSVKLFMLAFI